MESPLRASVEHVLFTVSRTVSLFTDCLLLMTLRGVLTVVDETETGTQKIFHPCGDWKECRNDVS